MQTHCPHCDTRFRVTEVQLSTADGFVRCGVCKEVFNAFEVASQNDHQHSLLNKELSNSNLDQDSLETNDSIEKETLEIDSNDVNNTKIDNEAGEYFEVQQDDESNKDGFDFFDETVNESLPHVVPDQFREAHLYKSNSITPTVLWSIGILLLTASLYIEYVWFNRDQFSQITEFKTLIDNTCKQFECKKLSVREPSKIELITRNVYSHPNEKNALIVDITMKNNAKYAQPYPVLQIDFSDIRGGAVAARRFFPDDYLSIEDTQNKEKQPLLIQPDTSTSVTLEIKDPGKQAMTYEFNFL